MAIAAEAIEAGSAGSAEEGAAASTANAPKRGPGARKPGARTRSKTAPKASTSSDVEVEENDSQEPEEGPENGLQPPVGPSSQEPQSDTGVPDVLVFLVGLSLWLVAMGSNGTLMKFWGLTWNGKPATPITKNELLSMGGSLLFIVILSFLAKFSAEASKVILALFFGLWLVWAIVNSNTLANWLSGKR